MRILRSLLTGAMIAGLSLSTAGLSTGADLQSLRGSADITENNQAPEIHKQIQGSLFDKNYRQQPPLIPHKIEKYQIDVKANECLACHDWNNHAKYGAPKISETHFRNRDGANTDQVSSNRWFCNTCHVPQADAPALVENTFKPAK